MFSVSSYSLDFGTVALSQSSSLSVSVLNPGPGSVAISQITLTGAAFSTSATAPMELAPGSQATLTISFAPTTPGAQSGVLTIRGGSEQTMTVALSGVGAAETAPDLSALSCTTGSFTGSGSDTCTVTLTVPADASGLVVALASDSAAVTLPASVTVPAGATQASFTATVAEVSTAATATLTATAGTVTVSYALELLASKTALTLQPSSIEFGNVPIGTPPPMQSLQLTATGKDAVTIQSVTVTNSVFAVTGLTYPLTLDPGQSATLYVQFDPNTAGPVSGQIAIASNAVGGTLFVSLTGSGQHYVALSWDAPTSSDDPVAGYNVYRAPAGSTDWQLLNSQPDTPTTYLDTGLQGGDSYDYLVRSVDASSIESVSSNSVEIAVPF